jgi:hypothetical protein
VIESESEAFQAPDELKPLDVFGFVNSIIAFVTTFTPESFAKSPIVTVLLMLLDSIVTIGFKVVLDAACTIGTDDGFGSPSTRGNCES